MSDEYDLFSYCLKQMSVVVTEEGITFFVRDRHRRTVTPFQAFKDAFDETFKFDIQERPKEETTMKSKLVTYTKQNKSFLIGFKGLGETDAGGVNTFRQIASDIFDSINLAAKQYELPKSHKGLAMDFNFSGSGEDNYDTYKLWKFPIFPRNKDELVIHVKVWTGSTHGGSCVMWCDAYAFRDIPSSAQFEVQCNKALQFAEAQAKKYTRLNLPK
jgi:hypothetical protein